MQGSVVTGDHVLELRGRTVVVDGVPVDLTTRQSAVLAALVEAGPGRVLSRPELLAKAWPGERADEHAVEMTVNRLRKALGAAGATVQTVVKRGYRLASPEERPGTRTDSAP